MILEAPSPVRTFGDGDLMREAISNLIDNAIKFTPEGGAITVSAFASQGHVALLVGDNGHGVPPSRARQGIDAFCAQPKRANAGKRPQAEHRFGHREAARTGNCR